ncbi:MAG: tRNA lysidine(34) synthetase TilS, partial [Planctomycetales bacterium]|nr:tRNA lysidine(34) synthetase TilS [Planctomycetales bacterium]
EADADEASVRRLCDDLNVPLTVGKGDVPAAAAAQGDGLEAAAREARYEFLTQAAHEHGARFVATAHTADDQAETILHRILRGTGVAGLAGMAIARPLSPAVSLVRPMLAATRRHVLAYLAERGIAFREDASNRDVTLTRNRLRHELLPLLRSGYNGEVDAALLRLGALAAECQKVIDALVDDLQRRAVVCERDQAIVHCDALAGQAPYVVRELLMALWRQHDWPQQPMSFQHWQDLAATAQSGPALWRLWRRDLPGGVRAEKKGEQLVLTRPC